MLRFAAGKTSLTGITYTFMEKMSISFNKLHVHVYSKPSPLVSTCMPLCYVLA